jgi:hypothetical protein
VTISSSWIRVPIVFIADRADYIAEYFAGTDARTEAAWRTLRCRRIDFGDGLAEAGDEDGLTGFENLLKHCQARGFEFGDSYVVHEIHLKVD